jgi:hypothetical protein
LRIRADSGHQGIWSPGGRNVRPQQVIDLAAALQESLAQKKRARRSPTSIRSAAIYRGGCPRRCDRLHMHGGIGLQFPSRLNSRILGRLEGKRLFHAA